MLTDAELSSLRLHLGYGAISIDAAPYTPDGFQAIFEQVSGPNLTTGPERQCAFAIAAGSSVVTPDSMTGIVARASLVIDVGDDAEIITVRSVTPTTFAAKFQRAHPVNTPIAVMSGTARLRLLLHRADQAWSALQFSEIGSVAGLQSVDRGDLVWFEGGQVLKDRLRHHQAIVTQISTLVRVPVRETSGARTLSIY